MNTSCLRLPLRKLRTRLALLTVLLPLLSLLAVPRITFAESFKNPKFIPVSGFSGACCIADLNADGKPDIVSFSGNTLTILLNSGNGTFTTAQTITVAAVSPYYGRSLSVGDINSDGYLDLVIVASPGVDGGGLNTITLLGNGDGTFRSPVTSNLSFPNFNAYFSAGRTIIGDFNDDGKPDLIFNSGSPGSTASIYLARGDGQGNFTLQSGPIPVSSSLFFVGDFNGDGHLDFVEPNGLYFKLHLGNGDGTFHDGANFGTNAYNFSAMADMNHDGRQDFVSAFNGTLNISLSNGDGTFTTSSTALPAAAGLFAIADVNQDGIPDLLSTYRGLSVLLGQGGTSFAAPISTAVQAGTFAFNSALATAVVDLNGDGIPDLLEPENGRYVLYLGKGNGAFASADIYPVGETVTGVVVGDFTGDKKADIGVSVLAPYPRVLAGDGNGNFAATTDQNVGAAATSTSNMIKTGDFNGDRKLDVATLGQGYGSSNFSIFFGRGDGSFQPAQSSNWGSLIVADVNKDGRSDLLSPGSVNGYPVLQASLGQADGTFLEKTSSPLGLFNGSIGPIDINKDGNPDLFVTGNSGIQTALGNGDGTFSSLRTFNGLGGPFYLSNTQSADLDGDGYPDIIGETSALSTATAYIFYGTADGGFTSPTPVAAGYNIRIADVDLDGKPDLIGIDVGGTSVQVLHNLGNRTFGNPDVYVAGTFPENVEVADFNGDGFPDLAVSNANTDTVTVLMNLGDAGATIGTLSISPEPSFHGQTITLVATVKSKLTADVPTGTIGFDIDGISLGAVPLLNGTATLTVTPQTQAGNHIINARYSGDATFTPSATSAVHIITLESIPIAIALTATPSTVLRSQSVRIIATTTASITPFGTVAFYDGATTLGSLLLAAGVAQLDTNLLSVGTHSITAKYLGSSDSYGQVVFPPATSAPATVTVSAYATSIALSLSGNSGTPGTPLTLTATVLSPGSPPPFGSVTFYDGTTPLGSSLLSSGTATWSTAFSSSGSHSLSALFQANQTFSGSTSSSSTFQANPTSAADPSSIAIMLRSQLASGTATHTTTTLIATLASVSMDLAAPSSHTISFFDGGQYLGSATTGTTGSASLALTPLTAGSHAIRAVLSADATLLSAQSPLLEEADKVPAAFDILPSSARVMLTPLSTVVLPIQILRSADFTGSVHLSCTANNPSFVCNVDVLSNTTGRLTISYANSRTSNQGSAHRLLNTASPLAFCTVILFGALSRKRRRRLLHRLLVLGVSCLLLSSLSACSNSYQRSSTSTLAVVTVRATGTTQDATLLHTQQIQVSLH